MVEILDMAKIIRGGQHNLTWSRLVGMLDYLAIVNVIKHGQDLLELAKIIQHDKDY